MKRNVLIAILIAGFSSISIADITEDMFAAQKLYSEKNYSAAKVEFQNIISNYPSSSSNLLAMAHIKIGQCLDRTGDRPGAVKEYDIAATVDSSVIGQAGSLKVSSLMNQSNFDDAVSLATSLLQQDMKIETKLQLQTQIGMVYKTQRNWKAASDAFQVAVDTYTQPTSADYRNKRGFALDLLGDMLVKQNKIKEASLSYMTYVKERVSELGAANESSAVWTVFNKIASASITKEEYVAFLNYSIQATKATEENAKFLGRLKSELGKMQ